MYDILCFIGSGSRRRMMSAKSSFGLLKSLIRKFGFLSNEGSKSFLPLYYKIIFIFFMITLNIYYSCASQ